MGLISQIAKGSKAFVDAFRVPGEPAKGNTEIGRRTTPENALKAIYRGMWVDPDLRSAILDVRKMDRLDGRVKFIHSKVAKDTVRGGLVLTQTTPSRVISKEWNGYLSRLGLDRMGKLKSDARSLAMTGNLPLQWVLDDQMNVVDALCMPAETLTPNTDEAGRFRDLQKAWKQIDMNSGNLLAWFPLWKLSNARLDPDSYDDLGSMGRPFLDASRTGWQKLTMSEEDLVIRRRTRAPQKLAHVLKGATQEELQAYQNEVEKNVDDIRTDFYLNKEGSVTAIQGDAQMGEIGDVKHLLDTWFAGSPVPKFLLGYIDGIPRDVLEELRAGYFDDIDYLQDEQAGVYDEGFQLHLLLKGINPLDAGYMLKCKERRTETKSQTTDRMLKWQALGIPPDMQYEEMGLDPAVVSERKAVWDKAHKDVYPGGAGGDQPQGTAPPNVSITPGNERMGNSATDITVRNKQ